MCICVKSLWLMLYRTGCWAVKIQQESQLTESVTKMEVLRWASCHTRQDKIGNKIILEIKLR